MKFFKATNSDNLLRAQRIGYKYASLLWYLSIEGMSLVSKRNMLANVIGMIFLYAREDLKLFRACTEEIIEHLFGWLRQVDKEVTISSMANWVDRMEAFFSAGVRSGLKRGSKNQKGYMTGYDGFNRSLASMQAKQQESSYRTGSRSAEGEAVVDLEKGVSIDRSVDAESAASQLWAYISPILKSVRKGSFSFHITQRHEEVAGGVPFSKGLLFSFCHH
jgi:ribosome modulation factor